MAGELTPAHRQMLKGRAHALDPVVLIGAEGLTPAVLAEVDRALGSHELIKIRVSGADRRERDRILDDICAKTDAAPVQHIGKIIVIYREKPPEVAPADSRPAPEKSRRHRVPAKQSGARGSKRITASFRPRRGRDRPR